jgi:type IV pilus assembly protein PilE
MRRLKQGGFTLIELMITVAIVAILARIAYPGYVSYVQKGARRAAQAQMLDLANREQQFLLSTRNYVTYDSTNTTNSMSQSGYTMPTEVSTKYTGTITIGSGSVPSYTITFTPITTGSQASDGALTLNSDGTKGCVPTCSPVSTKW